jgi:hypothetical protein
MREGNGNDGFVMNDVEECAGIHLRADYCSEHEWGIKSIRQKFGIDDTRLGIDKRRISTSGNVYLVEFKTQNTKCAFLTNYLIYLPNSFERGEGTWNDLKTFINPHRWFNTEHNEQSEGVAGAWNENNFLVVVKGTENIDKLKEVYEAFQTNDVAIFLGGGSGPFMNAGLSISIISQLPSEIAKDMMDIDMMKINLDKAAKKTGIHKKLEKAGLKYYALSPSWNDPETPSDGIKFWLNPSDQQANNHGWYTVEELKQWIKGKGPIPKKASDSIQSKTNSQEFRLTDDEGNIIV